MSLMGAVRNLLGIKGADGTTIASPDNPVPTTLNGRSIALVEEAAESATEVAAGGGNETVTFTPPAGKLWRPRMLFYSVSAPAGATSGKHSMEIQMRTADYRHSVFKAASLHTAAIVVTGGIVTTATEEVRPLGAEAQLAAIRGLVATNDAPLHIRYFNQTDVPQAGARSIRMVMEEENVA